jgi:2,4-dienoyl-CoA reductase-like NADH-dependent reductase (Old Yellow Enzyme family)
MEVFMKKCENVFLPIKIGNIEIKNRIEFSPAIPNLASPDGYVTRDLIEWEKSLARGGAGIVTIGDSAVDFEYAHSH